MNAGPEIVSESICFRTRSVYESFEEVVDQPELNMVLTADLHTKRAAVENSTRIGASICDVTVSVSSIILQHEKSHY